MKLKRAASSKNILQDRKLLLNITKKESFRQAADSFNNGKITIS
jgi:hypothetical protein